MAGVRQYWQELARRWQNVSDSELAPVYARRADERSRRRKFMEKHRCDPAEWHLLADAWYALANHTMRDRDLEVAGQLRDFAKLLEECPTKCSPKR
jgi:hypothetical protein